MNTVLTDRVSKSAGNFLTNWGLSTIQGRLCTTDHLVYSALCSFGYLLVRFRRTRTKGQVVASPFTCTGPHKHRNLSSLSNEEEVHCAEKLVTCFGKDENFVPFRKSNSHFSIVQLSQLTKKEKMQACPCNEYYRRCDPFVQSVEERSCVPGGAPLCGAAPTGLTKLRKLCK
jgi:hypothetical protein